VTVTAPYRKVISQPVTIEPGKDRSLLFSLDPDQEALGSLAKEIHSAFRSGNHGAVIRQMTVYLQAGGTDKSVLADSAISELELSRFEHFKRLGRAAIAGGATLRLRMQHHHAGWRNFLHPTAIELTNTTLRFQPEGRCNSQPFEVALSQLRVGNRAQVSVPNGSTLDSGKRDIWSIQLIVPNPGNPQKNTSLNLVTIPEDPQRTDAIRDFLQGLIHPY